MTNGRTTPLTPDEIAMNLTIAIISNPKILPNAGSTAEIYKQLYKTVSNPTEE